VTRSTADGVLDVSSTLFSEEPATEYVAAANTDDADRVAARFAEEPSCAMKGATSMDGAHCLGGVLDHPAS
jgi:hypothetical protein